MTAAQERERKLTVIDLINLLENFDPALPVYVRMSEPIYLGDDDQIDYWQITSSDVIM